MHSHVRTFAFATVALLMTACTDTEPTMSTAPSFLRATIQQAAGSISYDGKGMFNVSSNPAAGIKTSFSVYSETQGAARQDLMLYRQGDGRPAAGHYELRMMDPADGASRGFTAWYSRTVGDTVEMFAARSGEVIITKSSPDAVEGTFRFSARLSDRRWGGPGTAPGGERIDDAADVPVIEISGSFRATPETSRGGPE
jgi:hypothetical protein